MKQPVADHVQWPAERFYWGLLDASVIRKANPPRGPRGPRRLHQQLGYLFENVLPGTSIEEIHAVYAPLPKQSRSFLACGLQKDVLRQEVPTTALTLCPQALPDFIANAIGNGRDVPSLNLLTGPFAPRPVRALKHRCRLQVTASLIVCALVLITGIERRVASTDQAVAAIASQRDDVCRDVLGPAAGASTQPLGLRLLAELRQLEQTRSATGPDLSREDCALVLADLITLWPRQVRVQTESISITPASINLRAQVPDMADAQALASAFLPLKGWQVAQPQSEARKDQVDVSLRLERRAGKAGPS